MHELTLFENPSFGKMRTTVIDGEPWFVATDVCKCLDIGNSRQALTRLDDDEKGVISNDTPGGKQDMSVINEPGLYALVLSSRKPEAKEFKRWITHEVLPAIRKTGSYQLPSTPEQRIAAALVEAHKILDDYRERNQLLAAENSRLLVDKTVMQPKADYFDELVERNTLTNFRETAKQLGLGPKKFVGFLLEHRYIYRDKKGKLLPYEDKNRGLFEVKEAFNEKTQWSGTQTLVTPKGRETFRLLCQGM